MSNAIALNSIQFNLARVLGPVLAGVVLASFGAAGTVASQMFLSFAIVLGSVLLPGTQG